MRVPGSVAVTVVSLLLVLIVAGASLSVETRNYPWLSTSPENPGEGGSNSFYGDLAGRYRVVLGGPGSLSRINGTVLYLVIGPDKPFTAEEAGLITERVREGTLTLLVADETNATASLLAMLGLKPLGSTKYNESVKGGGWEWVVELSCYNETIYTTKAVAVDAAGASAILCRYGDGSPAAALYSIGKGGVVVVGDSSIFANFLYRGDYPLLPATRSTALTLVEGLASARNVIVYDDVHYDYTPTAYGLYYLSGLGGEAARSLGEAYRLTEGMDRVTLLFIVLSASAPWAAIMIFPSQPPPRRRTRLEEHEEWLASIEASRVGVEGGERLDPDKVAERILKVTRGGGDS